jgi:hypothetical protein
MMDKNKQKGRKVVEKTKNKNKNKVQYLFT